MSRRAKTAVGIGALAAALAVVAGVHYLSGERGKKNRAKLKSWMVKAKREVIARVERIEELDRKAYHAVVDEVARRYRGLKDVDPDELRAMAADMKAHWSNIHRRMQRGMIKPAPRARKRNTARAPRAKTTAAR
jgi:hypothetical protein